MDILLELLKSCPQAVAGVVVVVILVKYFERRDRFAREYDEEREKRVVIAQQSLNADHIYHREQSRHVIERNTAVIEKNAVATERNTFVVDAFSRNISELLAKQRK